MLAGSTVDEARGLVDDGPLLSDDVWEDIRQTLWDIHVRGYLIGIDSWTPHAWSIASSSVELRAGLRLA